MNRFLDTFDQTSFDVLIIGGGITGAAASGLAYRFDDRKNI